MPFASSIFLFYFLTKSARKEAKENKQEFSYTFRLCSMVARTRARKLERICNHSVYQNMGPKPIFI